MVQCDICNIWYHTNCIGIQDENNVFRNIGAGISLSPLPYKCPDWILFHTRKDGQTVFAERYDILPTLGLWDRQGQKRYY